MTAAGTGRSKRGCTPLNIAGSKDRLAKRSASLRAMLGVAGRAWFWLAGVTRLGEGATAGDGVDIVFGSLNSFGTGLRYGMDDGCLKVACGRAGRVLGGGGKTG